MFIDKDLRLHMTRKLKDLCIDRVRILYTIKAAVTSVYALNVVGLGVSQAPPCLGRNSIL